MLTLEFHLNHICLESVDLELNPRFLDLLKLAALRHLENNPDLSSADVHELPSWGALQENSIAVLLAKEHKKYQTKLGTALLTGSFSKTFQLNPALTPQFSLPLEQIWVQLQPKPSLITLGNNDAEAQAQLSIGKILIERGKLSESLETFGRAFAVQPSTSIKQEVLFYKTRVYEFQSDWEAAKKTLTSLKKCLEYHEHNNHPIEPVAYAWLHIANARIHIRHAEWKEAKPLYIKAKRYLNPHQHREWGMIHNGLGRVYQNSQTAENDPQLHLDQAREINLSQALKEYETALQHYHLDNWNWAIQASLNDCGVIYKERYKLIWQQQPLEARKHLSQALRCFMLCHQICTAENTGNESAVVEINLGWVYRMYNDTVQSRIWLEKAVELATEAGNQSDLGWALCEYAELEVQMGNPKAAMLRLEQAIDVFDAVDLHEARTTAQVRLRQVRAAS